MRAYIFPLIFFIATASAVTEEELLVLECKLVEVVVNTLRAAPSATPFCSSLIEIPIISVTSTTSTTVTEDLVIESTQTTTSTLTETVAEFVTTSTTTLTADTVTSTITE